MKEGIQFDEEAVCDVCGKFGAYKLNGETLCADCYQNRASCCPEFGGEDQWKFLDQEERKFAHETDESHEIRTRDSS